jgi:hypothetical protein
MFLPFLQYRIVLKIQKNQTVLKNPMIQKIPLHPRYLMFLQLQFAQMYQMYPLHPRYPMFRQLRFHLKYQKYLLRQILQKYLRFQQHQSLMFLKNQQHRFHQKYQKYQQHLCLMFLTNHLFPILQ